MASNSKRKIDDSAGVTSKKPKMTTEATNFFLALDMIATSKSENLELEHKLVEYFIKKDIKLMLNIARKQGGNLEMKLYELNPTATKNKIEGAEKLYHLLVHLYDNEGIESRLVEEKMEAEYGVLYMLEEHITYGFEHDKQVAPLSLLIRHERAPELINSINQHGGFIAEMFEWNQKTHEAHLQLHPSN